MKRIEKKKRIKDCFVTHSPSTWMASNEVITLHAKYTVRGLAVRASKLLR